jgi:hypothetical protein
VATKSAGGDGSKGTVPSAGSLSLPSRRATPLAAVARRMLLAVGLLAVSAVIVYLGRSGYRDTAHAGLPDTPSG